MAVVESIQASGGDHVDPSAWESSIPGSVSDSYTGEMADETFTTRTTISSHTGTSATNFLRLTAQSGTGFDGTRDNGPVIAPSLSTNQNVLDCDNAYTELDTFCIDGGGGTPPGGSNTFGRGVDIGASNQRVHHLVIYDMASSKKNHGFSMGTTYVDIAMYRCAIHGIEGGSGGWGKGIEFYSDGAGTNYCYNNSVEGCNEDGLTISADGASAVLKCDNNISMNNGAADFSYAEFNSSTLTTHGNLSEDATADDHETGSPANLISKTTASNYTSTTNGSEDLHLVNGSADAIDAGADLGTTPGGYGGDGVEVDIDGYDCDGGGVTWDIGFDQQGLPSVGGGAVSIIPQIMHHRRQSGVS
jgi:hypothetical protein